MKEEIEEKGITKSEMVELLSWQFDTVFKLIDSSRESLKTELTFLFKTEIGELRKEMNHRFELVDERFMMADKRFDVIEKRLSSIENNMVYQYEHKSLLGRVEKLEV